MNKLELGTLTRSLLGACALLGLIVLAEALAGASLSDGDAERTAADDIALPALAANRYTHAPLSQFAEILERPIFLESRRMPIDVVEAPAPTPSVPLRLELEGIAMVADTRIAVLRDASTKSLIQLAEGSEHNGWTLESVSAGQARFSRGDEVHELGLELDPSLRPRR